jgi:hypothetical protein
MVEDSHNLHAMRKTLFLRALGVVLSLALLTGCASSRVAPPAAVPPPEAATASTEEPVTPREIVQAAAAKPLSPVPGDGWRSLFDGVSLDGWRVTDFGGPGRVELQDGLMVFRMGSPFTGANYTKAVPKQNYEVTMETMRVAGDDFFCGLTFPAGDSFASLIVGGWGGRLVGISSIDFNDASENETTQTMTFETGHWYRIRLRVTEQRLEAWIDQKKIVNVVTTGRKLSLRPGQIELSKPFGLASWLTSAAFRDVKIRDVSGPADPAQ